MYFKEKDNTNIDEEFQGKKQFDIQKYKPLILIVGGIIVLFVVVFIMFSLTKKEPIEEKITYDIQLNGNRDVNITLGNDYIESGYTAYDSNGNDVTDRVTVSSNIKVNELGTYEISYTINDAKVIRYVNIIEPTKETYIYLKGNKNIYLDLNEKYIEPGYVSHDTVDGSLTDKVKVSGTVNTNKKGLYKVVYTVTNSREVTTQVERNVIVGEQKPTK